MLLLVITTYEPRSIYGKIVSSADRNTSIDIPLQRTYAYSIVHEPELSLEEMIERARTHLIDKFGNKGYATEKMYFKDEEYENFLKEIAVLIANKDKFLFLIVALWVLSILISFSKVSKIYSSFNMW